MVAWEAHKRADHCQASSGGQVLPVGNYTGGRLRWLAGGLACLQVARRACARLYDIWASLPGGQA